jgi:carbon storage regulator
MLWGQKPDRTFRAVHRNHRPKGVAMLVLTRKSGESILIGGDVRVRVLGASGSRVRLGIEAPDDVRIVREKSGEPSPAEIMPVPEIVSVAQPAPLLRRA